MNRQHIVGALVVVLSLTSFACSGGDDTAGTTAGSSSSSGAGGEGGGGTGGGAGGMPPVEVGFVSIAHLSPDAPPIEICVGDGSGNFMGPVLGSSGLVKGLAYKEILAHIPIYAGPSTYRVVPADAASCDAPLKDSRDADITIEPNKIYTFMMVGQSSPPDDAKAIQFKSLEEAPSMTEDKLNLRFINASPSAPSLDLGTGSDNTFKPLFADVAYGSAGMVSGATYLEMDPLVDATLSIRAHGAAMDTLVGSNISLPGGSVATAYAISDSGKDASPTHMLLCNTNAPKKNFTFIQCSTLP